KKVTEDMENLRFNTAISQLMVFVNEAYKQQTLPKPAIEDFVKLLSPIAPHISEELWEILGHRETIAYEPWPTYDESQLVEKEIEIVIQINGKVRAKKNLPVDTGKEELERLVMEDAKIKQHLAGKTVRK